MDGLTCQYCNRCTNQFTILQCDHITCAQCLWTEVKSSLQGVNTILCKCGAITQFSSKNGSNITVTTSPRRQQNRKMRTQAATFSIHTPSSPQMSRAFSREDRPVSELQCELQFLSIQYRKSIEQAERNFTRIVDKIKAKYQSLVNNIRMFWLEEGLESKQVTLLQLPKLLMRKYNKSVGTLIQRLNDRLLEQLTAFRLETVPHERSAFSSCKHREYIPSKQNLMINNTCLQQRRRLFQAIEQLKQGRGIKKTRKVRPVFQRV